MSSGPGLPVLALMVLAGGVAFVAQALTVGAVTPLWWVAPLGAAFVVALVARHL